MTNVGKLFYLYFIMNSIRSVLLLSIRELPNNDVVIDINKGYALRGLGVYSPNVVEQVVHSFVPLSHFCIASPNADVCVYDSELKKTNIFQLATIMTTLNTVHTLSSYNRDSVSRLIGRDISRILAQHHPNQFNTNNKSIVHLINNHLYYQKTIEKILMKVPSNDDIDNYSDIPRVHLTSAEILLQQINNNRISFDYLSHTDLKLFLTAVFSTIRSSYTISNVQDSLNTFTQLIVGQSVHVLRYCSFSITNSLLAQPCLAVSTLFLGIPADSVSTFSVYRLTPLPVIFNDDKYIYSNLPKIIGINSIDQTLIMWNDDLAINECTFSPIVLCRHKPVSTSLSKVSCLSQLFDDHQLATSMCEVSRSQNIQQDVLHIDDGIWLFYNVHHTAYCQVYSNTNGLPETISIREAAVVHMPCDKTITCTDFQIPTAVCKEKRVIITPNLTFNLQNLSRSIVPIQNMTQMILSSYHVQSDKSVNDLMTAIKSKGPTLKETIHDLALYILSAICSIFVLIFVYIRKYLKYNARKEYREEITDLRSQIHDIVDF